MLGTHGRLEEGRRGCVDMSSEAYMHVQTCGYDRNPPQHTHAHTRYLRGDTQTHLALLNSCQPALDIGIRCDS